MSILHHFRDIIDHFPKFKKITSYANLIACVVGDLLSVLAIVQHIDNDIDNDNFINKRNRRA